MRDFTTIISIYGKTAVSLSTWRNGDSTAFASVTIADHKSDGLTYEAKSQGPSAGGYHKPTQALERLSGKLSAIYAGDYDGREQYPATWLQMVAQAAEALRLKGGAK